MRANFLLDSESRLRGAMALRARQPQGGRHDSPHHRLLGGAPLAGAAGGRRAGRRRGARAARHPPRRAARSLRHPGHHLLALGPLAGHPRGPGHLPDRHRAPRRAARARGARFLRLRLLLRLRRLPGRHRHLLGALAGARSTCRRSSRACPTACRRNWAPTPPASAGSSSTPGGPVGEALAGRTALVPGLDAALRAAVGAGRGRGGGDRRLHEAVPDHRRSQSPGRVRHPARTRSIARGARFERRGGRPAARMERHRVHGARRAATRTSVQDFESIVVKVDAQGTPDPVARRGARRAGPEIRRGVADLDGLGDHVGGIVVMRHGENALQVIEPRAAEAARAGAVAAGRASRSSPPTTAPTSSRAPCTRCGTSSSSR